MSARDAVPASGWSLASARWRKLWWLKTAGISLFMTGFFVAYFQVLRHPAHAVTTMPVTALDRLIPFQAWSLAPYLSLWVYVSLAPGLLASVRALGLYGAAAALVAAVGLGIFYFAPTAVPPADVDWSAHPQFAFLKSVDASGNACPSLHVAFAVMTAIQLHAQLRVFGAGNALKALNWIWAVAICYSTLASKQHVALDAVCGAVLGAAGGWLAVRLGLARRS